MARAAWTYPRSSGPAVFFFPWTDCWEPVPPREESRSICRRLLNADRRYAAVRPSIALLARLESQRSWGTEQHYGWRADLFANHTARTSDVAHKPIGSAPSTAASRGHPPAMLWWGRHLHR